MFSQDCRGTVVRHSHDIVNSPKFRGDRFGTLARTSHNSHATVLRNVLAKKIRLKFILNMFKTFATSLRYMKILTTFMQHSHDCRAKVRDPICKTVARNSHDSRKQ